MHFISITLFIRGIFPLLIAFLGCQSPVSATSWQENLYFNGFFTLDITRTTKELGIVGAAGKFRMYQEGEVNIKNSLIGGQLEYQFNDDLTGFIQGAGYFNTSGDVSASVDWAYMSYDFGADTQVRLGQFQIPFLQGTELRKVGYSRLWTRPLIPGNGASGFNDYLGVELLKQFPGDGDYWELQLAAGEVEHELAEMQGDNMELLSLRYGQKNIWLRGALMQADYTLALPAGLGGADEVVMGSVEGEILLGKYRLNLGYSHSHADFSLDDTMHYASLAYSRGNFTPFLFAARLKLDFNNSLPGEGALEEPELIQLVAAQGDITLSSVAAGVRWQMTEQLVFKVQLENLGVNDEVQLEADSVVDGGNILTLVLDGIF